MEGKGDYEAMHQLLEGDNKAWAKADREQIREDQDSVGNDADWKEFDMPSLDLKRDLIFEEGRVLRNQVYFNEDAGEQVGFRTQASMWDKERQEKVYALSEMVPPDPDEAMTPQYKNLIEEEFVDYKDKEQQLLQKRMDLQQTLEKCRDHHR